VNLRRGVEGDRRDRDTGNGDDRLTQHAEHGEYSYISHNAQSRRRMDRGRLPSSSRRVYKGPGMTGDMAKAARAEEVTDLLIASRPEP
jgi:hypothetical protein